MIQFDPSALAAWGEQFCASQFLQAVVGVQPGQLELVSLSKVVSASEFEPVPPLPLLSPESGPTPPVPLAPAVSVDGLADPPPFCAEQATTPTHVKMTTATRTR